MTTEQEYFREELRQHNGFLHGWGVVCGCSVEPYPDKDHPWQVRICCGYVITPQWHDIFISEPVNFDLAGDCLRAYDPCVPSPCPPTAATRLAKPPKAVFLAACYVTCNTRPVRVHPVGCSCDETTCEYSRIRDSFELVRLPQLPESHVLATKSDESWAKAFKAWIKGGANPPAPVPDCPDCAADDCCVVLAKITLPDKRDTPITGEDISYQGRRVVYSGRALTSMILT
jgi:hypothetical protein